MVRRLIDEAEGRGQPILATAIALAALTGARRGELCGLRWSDVDENAGILHIRRAAKHGLNHRQVVLRDTKTHSERHLALDTVALAVLDTHRERARSWAASAGVSLQEDGFVLTYDPTGQEPMRPDSLGQAYKRLTARIGVTLRFHDLRHFAATQLIGAGINARTVAARLGHADPSVTLRVYSHALEEKDQEAAAILGELLTPSREEPSSPDPFVETTPTTRDEASR
jgi:integrase